MWQDVIVGAVVALAGLYALWYWMPSALRKRLGAVRPALGKSPSCGACSSCGGCGPTKKGSAADALKTPPPAAVKVHKSA